MGAISAPTRMSVMVDNCRTIRLRSAISNVLAVGIVLFSITVWRILNDSPMTTAELNAARSSSPYFDDVAMVQWTRRPVRFAIELQWSGIRKSDASLAYRFMTVRRVPATLAHTTGGGSSQPNGFCEFQIGWPFKGMSSVIDNTSPMFRPIHGVRIAARKSGSRPWYGVLPTRVLWFGLMGNIICWCMIVFACQMACLSMRAHMRRCSNECSACGYCLNGITSDRCPECGHLSRTSKLYCSFNWLTMSLTMMLVMSSSGCEALVIIAAEAAEPQSRTERVEYWEQFPRHLRPLEYSSNKDWPDE